MAPIPIDLLWVEVAYDDVAQVAHRRGHAVPAGQPEGYDRNRTRRQLPADRYEPKCGGKALVQVSAYTADQRGAEACPADACFGRELAAGPPAFVRLEAQLPKRTVAGKRRGRLAVVK